MTQQSSRVALPQNFRFLDQYTGSRVTSNADPVRSLSAALAMAAQIAGPGRWVPRELEQELTQAWASLNGTKTLDMSMVEAWLKAQSFPYVDLATHLQDTEILRQVFERQNSMNIPQVLIVADDSKLLTLAGDKLHPWSVVGEPTALLRVGFVSGAGAGLYFTPGAPGFGQPVAISWANAIVPAQVTAALAIMPFGVSQPPEDLSWLTETWPIVIPQPDLNAVQQAITEAARTLEQHEQETRTALVRAFTLLTPPVPVRAAPAPAPVAPSAPATPAPGSEGSPT